MTHVTLICELYEISYKPVCRKFLFLVAGIYLFYRFRDFELYFEFYKPLDEGRFVDNFREKQNMKWRNYEFSATRSLEEKKRKRGKENLQGREIHM
jgi:hypothetical protein